VIAGVSAWVACEALTIHARTGPSQIALLKTYGVSAPLGVFAAGVFAAAFGATAPDLDLVFGQHAHRKATHSLIGLGFFAVAVALAARAAHLPAAVAVAAIVGFVSHLLTDCLTVHGCPLLWPGPRCFHLLPEAVRISTGGKRRRGEDDDGHVIRGLPVGEFAVSAVSIAVALLTIYGSVHVHH
jgi:hypothetical protein